MKTHTRVAVIGGGAMGVSLLYHLTKRGWSDVVLIEKNELTAGSTWHAAGLCTHFAHNLAVMNMRAHSVNLYKNVLAEETGEFVDFHACGALRMTKSKDRMDEFRHVQGIGKFGGQDFHILSPSELKDIYPLVETDGLIGAIYEPKDGHVDPTQATNAMARGARDGGAEIYRHTKVIDIQQLKNGEWLVKTDKGDIQAEIIVNAAGTWCREIGEMMGLDLPVVPMLHQYMVTDAVPEVDTLSKELPIIRDPEESWYVRQEHKGFIIGPYEQVSHPWAVDGVPPEFGMELLPPELGWMEDILAMSMVRIPVLAEAGLKTIVNGPITFTPDANLLLGPAYGLNNAWLLTGSSMGVMEGGGAGWMLADWIVDGEQPMDLTALDPRRFGEYADRNYRLAKADEAYSRQFAIHYPYEELEAGRELYTTPIYDDLQEAGAVFGFAYGWERPNYFAKGEEAKATTDSFRRTNWFEAVKREVELVHNSVGVADLSVFSKYEISGPDAVKFMEKLGANRPPQQVGRVGLVHALAESGGVLSEFTVTKVEADKFYLTSAAAARRQDSDLLRIRSNGFNISIKDKTHEIGILGVMGPKSKDVLSQITDASLENADFPRLSAQTILVEGVEITALRVSYVGELGWELHCPLEQLQQVYSAVMKAGKSAGIGHYGAYAMNSMRLEKGYRAWGSEFSVERTPLENDVAFLVKTEGRDFIGKDALLAREQRVDHWSMALFELEASAIDPFYSHSVLQDGKAVGMVTSGAYGHRVGKSLCLAFLTENADRGAGDFKVEILGEQFDANILTQAPFDPDNTRMKNR